MDKVFEMLWDCRYCGTRKLLGKTHRFCPGCGAPQDPTARYFPSDEDKVEVHDHIYVGADRHCPACGSAMSARASHCTQCGSPLDGATPVALISDAGPAAPVLPFVAEPAAPDPAASDPTAEPASPVEAAPTEEAASEPAPAPPRTGRLGLCLALGAGLAFLAAAGFCALFYFTEEAPARVTGRAWTRAIEIESFLARSDSDWCDRMPAGAYNVRRSQKQSGTRSIANGEDCHTVRTDQGDGTFREKEECTTRYREEPVYSDHCAYTLDAWGPARTAQAKGTGRETPQWPAPSLRKGSCLGCEREGKRSATQSVTVVVEGSSTTCDVSEAAWAGAPEGTRMRVQRTRVGGIVLCSSLSAPR